MLWLVSENVWQLSQPLLNVVKVFFDTSIPPTGGRRLIYRADVMSGGSISLFSTLTCVQFLFLHPALAKLHFPAITLVRPVASQIHLCAHKAGIKMKLGLFEAYYPAAFESWMRAVHDPQQMQNQQKGNLCHPPSFSSLLFGRTQILIRCWHKGNTAEAAATFPSGLWLSALMFKWPWTCH